jgi:YVTN family beta-propeller protein
LAALGYVSRLSTLPEEVRMARFGHALVLLTLTLALAVAACAPVKTNPRAASRFDPEGGPLHVYAEADLFVGSGGSVPRLSRVTAVRLDGGRVDLNVERRGRSRWEGERLLAWGSVPEGEYTALLFEGEPPREGPGEVPGASRETSVPLSLRLGKGRGAVIRLALGEGGRLAAREPKSRPAAVLGAVPLEAADAVLLFDRLDGTPVTVVPAGDGPTAVGIDTIRSRAYATVPAEDRLEIIDLVDGVNIGFIPLIPGDEPTTLALTPDGALAVVANRGSGTVSVVDLPGRTERARVSIGERPTSVALDGTRRRAYVSQEIPGSVAVVDYARGEVVDLYSTEARPARIRLDGSARRLLVAHGGAPSLVEFDTALGTAVRRIELGSPAAALALDARAGTALVAVQDGPLVDAYGPASDLPERSYVAEGRVRFLEVDDEGNALCIVYEGRDEIRLLQLVGGQTLARLETGPGPGEPAFSGSR